MGNSLVEVTGCNPTTGALTLGPTDNTDTGSNRNCTDSSVVNPEYPGKPGCLFGPPLPIPNASSAGTSTCVINRVVTDASGNASCNDGSVALLNLPLSSDLYLTGDLLDGSAPNRPAVAGIQPCPICTPGGGCASGTCCKGGVRHDMDCSPDSSALGEAYPTTHDCPPPGADTGIAPFIGSLPIPFALTTGTSTKTSTDLPAQPFVFCGFCGQQFAPIFQGPPAIACTSDAQCTTSPFTKCRQRNPGAFAQGPARTIIETGSAADACISDGQPHDSTLVSVFCIPPAFNATVDAAADLPGPGAVALPGQAQFLP
jgi:hypothetical protein